MHIIICIDSWLYAYDSLKVCVNECKWKEITACVDLILKDYKFIFGS